MTTAEGGLGDAGKLFRRNAFNREINCDCKDKPKDYTMELTKDLKAFTV